MAFLLCLLGTRRLLTVNATTQKREEKREKEKKRRREEKGRRSRAARLYRGFAVGGLQELDFNPLESISTLEKRDPRRKKEKV